MPYIAPTEARVLEYNPSFTTLFKEKDHMIHYPKIRNILRYTPDQTIAFEGDDINYIYEIITGTVKTYKMLDDGRCLITGFYTRGDVIGLPTDGKYFHTTEAITETSVCCYSKAQIEGLMQSNAGFTRKIIKMAHEKLRDAHEQMVSLGRKTPEERIATFLLNCRKWATIQIASQKKIITLPMSRLDIADYLGLTQETVCRVFSKFRKNGLITPLSSDQLLLNNDKQLSRLAELA